MQVERAEEVVKLPAIWRSPLQLLGLLPVIPVLVDLLDPKVEVAVGLLGKGDEASKRGGVAVAGASGALALQTLGAAASMGVQHLFSKSKSPTRMRRWSGSRKTLTNSTMGSRDIAR